MKFKQILYEIENFLLEKQIITLDHIYKKKFFEWHHNEKILREYETVTKIFYDRFTPKSVIDFGCGTGIYLHFFSKLGVEHIKGLEGCQNAISLALVKNIEKYDITKKIKTNTKYDICLCFEVAEHIHKKYAETLIHDICLTSDIILFSAAIPKQTGRHHINLQPKQYWINKFKFEGFIYQKSVTQDIINKMPPLKSISWIKNNIMIFEKKNIKRRKNEILQDYT